MSQNVSEPDGASVSPELDGFTCEAIGECLDALASHETLWPRLYTSDSSGPDGNEVECEVFADDAPDLCLEAARAAAGALPASTDMYAIVYDGFYQLEEGGESTDALICVFAQRGMSCAWSAYVPYGFDDEDVATAASGTAASGTSGAAASGTSSALGMSGAPGALPADDFWSADPVAGGAEANLLS